MAIGLYVRFFKMKAHAILPYDEGLGRLPAFLQQGEMNPMVNQSVGLVPPDYDTCPIIFGEVGIMDSTPSINSFIRVRKSVVRFHSALRARHDQTHHHDILASHCFAQAEL